ncbi:MAG: LLM class flavin-dependent oxidoreductase [Acidimicrobiales bacterium]
MSRFGIVLPLKEASPGELIEAAAIAEEAGLDSVWVSDHLSTGRGGTGNPVPEAWTSLAAVAAATRRATVGSLVTRVSMRRPRVLAAMAQTVARIARGRLVVGLGIGDELGRAEEAAHGFALPTRRERLGLLEETIRLLRQHSPDVPVWVGGRSPALLRAAARVDGWSFWGPAEDFPKHRSRLESLAAGRMPESSWAGPFPGAEALRELGRVGADHLIVAVGAKNYRERIDQLLRVMRL